MCSTQDIPVRPAPERQKSRVLLHNDVEGGEASKTNPELCHAGHSSQLFPRWCYGSGGTWNSRLRGCNCCVNQCTTIFLHCKMGLNDTTFPNRSCQNRKQGVTLAFEVTPSTLLLEVFILLRSAVMN